MPVTGHNAGMSCAGVVLTGGASTRMGQDKATMVLDGASATLARRTARLLLQHTSPCVELGPGASGLPEVRDSGGGPLLALAGAARLWESLPADGHVVVVATDLPRLTGGLLAWLASHPAAGPVVPLDRGRRQPLCARYPVADLRRTPAAVAAGVTALRVWLAGLEVHEAPRAEWGPAAGDLRALRDADTPSDLAALGAAGGRTEC